MKKKVHKTLDENTDLKNYQTQNYSQCMQVRFQIPSIEFAQHRSCTSNELDKKNLKRKLKGSKNSLMIWRKGNVCKVEQSTMQWLTTIQQNACVSHTFTCILLANANVLTNSIYHTFQV